MYEKCLRGLQIHHAVGANGSKTCEGKAAQTEQGKAVQAFVALAGPPEDPQQINFSRNTYTQTPPPIIYLLHTGNKWSSGSLFELGGCIYPEGVIYLLVKYCFISEDEKYNF